MWGHNLSSITQIGRQNGSNSLAIADALRYGRRNSKMDGYVYKRSVGSEPHSKRFALVLINAHRFSFPQTRNIDLTYQDFTQSSVIEIAGTATMAACSILGNRKQLATG